MNRNDIIRMAKEAGGHIAELPNGDAWMFDEAEQLERFAALVAAAELNRCVLILERLHEQVGDRHNYYAHAVKVLKGEI